MAEHIVIAGAGHTAGQAAASLRQGGHDGPVTIVGEEPFPPYQRPPLSKKYLSGELDQQRLFLRHEHFYAEHDVTLRLGTRVNAIHRDANTLSLSDGTQLEYGKLLLATGSRVRRLRVDGHQLAGIHYLRTIDDVLGIRADISKDAHLVVVGGGYIGLEVAAVARQIGLRVTVLEAEERVMSRVVAPPVSAFFERVHGEAGVDIRCGTGLTAFQGRDRLEAVVTADGQVLPCDLAVVGIGIIAVDDLARDAGLECDDGIVVDEYCRTGDPDILAAGDCTRHPNGILKRRLRLESVHNAQEQAKTAAATLCGELKPYSQVPWFWSDQYDLKLQIVGLSDDHDQVVIRGDVASRSFAAFYLKEERIVAVDAVSSPREFMLSKKLIATGARIEPEILADTSIPFKDLAAAALE